MTTAKKALIERIQNLQTAGKAEYKPEELQSQPVWTLEKICDRMLLEAGVQ